MFSVSSVILETGVYLSSMGRRQDDIPLPVRLVISWWHCHAFLQTKWSMSISVILHMGAIQ